MGLVIELFSATKTRYISRMARYLCSICDLEEERCVCDKFCCLCQGYNDVRLVGDGLYYCVDCREACEYVPQKPLAH